MTCRVDVQSPIDTINDLKCGMIRESDSSKYHRFPDGKVEWIPLLENQSFVVTFTPDVSTGSSNYQLVVSNMHLEFRSTTIRFIQKKRKRSTDDHLDSSQVQH